MKQTIRFQDQDVLLLRNGAAEARIAPQHGGRLLDWQIGGRPLIHWPEQPDWTHPTKIRGGNPVLFPFLGRHYVDGVLGRWRDGDGTVREVPMHGFARYEPFALVETADPNEVRMRLVENERTLPGYPFPFRFEVAYRLGPQSLEAEFLVTNTGTRPLPYYAGHHFYFEVDHRDRAEWRVELPFRRTVTGDPVGNMIEGPAPADTLLSAPELSDRIHVEPLASRFSLLHRPDGTGVEIDLAPAESIPWYAVTTWTEHPDSDFYCVEPWLGLPNAIHHGQGLRRLAPGATEKAVVILRHRPGA